MPNPETPWTDPRPGDVCSAPRRKTRTVRSVSYRGWDDWRPHPDRRPGDWVDRVAYDNGHGALTTIAPSQWAAWCRAATRGGGTYKRAGEVLAR